MERYRISPAQAFAMIKHSASALDQKLHLIAERIISGRSLPDADLVALPHPVCATSIASGFDDDR